jgi:hypothetical protein
MTETEYPYAGTETLPGSTTDEIMQAKREAVAALASAVDKLDVKSAEAVKLYVKTWSDALQSL